jgi:lipopolysaccharide transport system ATP-binding protein
MSDTVISIENLSKSYRLGQIGTGTLSRDLTAWWASVRGKPNPMLKVGEKDHGNRDAETIWALKNVNFSVAQGEVLGIIGRNGAGKSTLLKILSEVTAPTSGEVKIKGRIASLLEVGTGFHPDLTGRENTYLNGAILGMSREEVRRKFDEIVDFAGIEQFVDTPVKRYSSGMYVRLAFAVAAHLEPEILLVDEVLAVGDIEFQKKCLGKMGDVARQGRTILFVSHNMGAVQNLCGKAALLKSGEMVELGDTDEIISDYLMQGKLHASFDLSVRNDRSGSGNARFTYVRLTRNGKEISDAQTGKELSIHIGYVRNPDSSPNASVKIAFKDHFGQRLFMCLSKVSHGKSLSLKESGEIICTIPEFPLIPGEYLVDAWCKLDSVTGDSIENAFAINVIQGDIYKTSMEIKNDGGSFAIKHSWQLENY